jgi:hypothetical protein
MIDLIVEPALVPEYAMIGNLQLIRIICGDAAPAVLQPESGSAGGAVMTACST